MQAGRQPSLYTTAQPLKVPIASILIVSPRSRPRLSRCLSPIVSISQSSVCFTSSLALYLASLPLQTSDRSYDESEPRPAPPWLPPRLGPLRKPPESCAFGACVVPVVLCATTKMIVTSTQNTPHFTHDNHNGVRSSQYKHAFATSTTTSLRQTASIHRGPSRQWRTIVFQPSEASQASPRTLD
ncbi:hypothetical protein CSPX01_02791 [Colletotrichum filicis]|nr:hypothetical protein CSPX01_02791 [Colletotrichum filicis]